MALVQPQQGRCTIEDFGGGLDEPEAKQIVARIAKIVELRQAETSGTVLRSRTGALPARVVPLGGAKEEKHRAERNDPDRGRQAHR